MGRERVGTLSRMKKEAERGRTGGYGEEAGMVSQREANAEKGWMKLLTSRSIESGCPALIHGLKWT